MGFESPRQLLANDRRTIEQMHRTAGCERWNVTLDAFTQALCRSAAQRFRETRPAARDVMTFLASLHSADLALACACAAGHEAAWEHFVREYRPKLYAAAGAICGGKGRDLADSLYADLYGLDSKEGRRRSLFEYFHGRSSLLTWLRAVLAQRHVDGLRAGRRIEPLADDMAEPADARSEPEDPDRARYMTLLRGALSASLAGLEARDRLRLSYYYMQDLTLAQIGRLTGEHEATVSRKLDRTRRQIRERVERTLRDEARLTEAQVRLCFEYAVEQWPFDMSGALSQSET